MKFSPNFAPSAKHMRVGPEPLFDYKNWKLIWCRSLAKHNLEYTTSMYDQVEGCVSLSNSSMFMNAFLSCDWMLTRWLKSTTLGSLA